MKLEIPMKKTSLHLLAMSTGLLLSFSPASAKSNTAFSDYTGADPLNAKYNLGINDGNDDSGGGGQAGESISGEGTNTAPIGDNSDQQQAQQAAAAAAQPDNIDNIDNVTKADASNPQADAETQAN